MVGFHLLDLGRQSGDVGHPHQLPHEDRGPPHRAGLYDMD